MDDGAVDESSPRPWGCFLNTWCRSLSMAVFPTPVGVFLAKTDWAQLNAGLPHARGGVSRIEHMSLVQDVSSPRPWGCFLFFGHFLILWMGLPHARGGLRNKYIWGGCISL